MVVVDLGTIAAVEVLDVRSHGLVGSFVTANGDPLPGVIVLGGSEGGSPAYAARLLAAEGFSCLALRYFGARGLPRHLIEVPLDYVEAALGWLGARPEVSGPHLGLLGVSRGLSSP